MASRSFLKSSSPGAGGASSQASRIKVLKRERAIVLIEMGTQLRKPFITHQHEEAGFRHPCWIVPIDGRT